LVSLEAGELIVALVGALVALSGVAWGVVKLSNRQANKAVDSERAATAELIAQQKARIDELRRDLGSARDQIVDLQTATEGFEAVKKQVGILCGQIEVLQNRLDNAEQALETERKENERLRKDGDENVWRLRTW
jgi:chromosome segregation ATPase